MLMSKQTKVWLVLSIVLSLLALGSACGGGKAPDTNTPTGDATATAYSGPTGTITGLISFNGTPPAPKKIDTSSDAVCGQKNPNLTTEETVVKDGKLANVFVYVKEGTVEGGKKVGDYAWATPTTAVNLDQNGCHYKPHVMESRSTRRSASLTAMRLSTTFTRHRNSTRNGTRPNQQGRDHSKRPSRGRRHSSP